MPGVTPITYASRLTAVQSMQETTWGTPLALATARWMGLAPYPSFKPYVKSTNYDEDRGSLGWAWNNNVLQRGGEYTINWTYLSYEDILFPLYNMLQAVTPTGGPAYVYSFAGPLTAVNSLIPFSLEYGYDINTGLYTGCIGQKFTIKAEAKKQWEGTLTGFYQQYNPNVALSISSSTNASPIEVTTSTSHGYSTGQQVVISGHLVNTAANGTWVITKTAANKFTLNTSTGNGVGSNTGTVTRIQTPAIADRTVNAIIFPGTTLAIDAAAGTPGTTPFTSALLGFQLDLENQIQPVFGADYLYPLSYAYDRFKVSLSLKLLNNAQTKTLIDSTLYAGSRVVVDLKQTSGTSSVEIEMGAILSDNPTNFGQDSNALIREIKLEGQYDTGTLANVFKMIVTNGVSALP